LKTSTGVAVALICGFWSRPSKCGEVFLCMLATGSAWQDCIPTDY
jgi:hypothetical protein